MEDSIVHLVHCFEVQLYTADFAPYVYPTEDKYPDIEEASKSILKGVEEELKNLGFKEVTVKNIWYRVAPSVLHVPFAISGFNVARQFDKTTFEPKQIGHLLPLFL